MEYNLSVVVDAIPPNKIIDSLFWFLLFRPQVILALFFLPPSLSALSLPPTSLSISLLPLVPLLLQLYEIKFQVWQNKGTTAVKVIYETLLPYLSYFYIYYLYFCF
jgi:hypothetical protein